ncbi:ATP-binding protein [Marinobacter sp. X15-166B]|uniref:ATP-binding protein n=1 Tax=Marinobacter sp. X15-166B TaxID=1897620 RepID=UPI00085C54B4|nr:ATP-binding protein [Marinobacter sp. X15-166B]OEY65814.1 hypothetical protein BG841_04665 [Marinobacter sp. X15-166B]
MSLKRQLLIAAGLMLLIPWAGLQFVLELDTALRQQALEQLHKQAERMAAAAAAGLEDESPGPAHGPAIYARPLPHTPTIDGYSDDWPGYGEGSTEPSGHTEAVSWQIGVDPDYLYLLLRVNQAHPVYFDPGRTSQPYESVLLIWQDGEDTTIRTIRTAAPGPVTGWQADLEPTPDYRIKGFWRARANGYQLELRLPRPADNGYFGFQVMRPQADGTGIRAVAGTGTNPLPRLITRRPELEARLSTHLLPGQEVTLLTPSGWADARVAMTADPPARDFDSLGPLQILEQINLNGLRALVRQFQPEPLDLPTADTRIDLSQLPREGLVRSPGGAPRLMALHPLSHNRTLILTQSLDQLLTLSGSTLGRVIARSALLVVVLMLAVLGYAGWLSWRITRLQAAVRASIDDDGRIIRLLPAPRHRDELGELGHQFSMMIARLQEYTGYLESFSKRLSHELKTPLTVVRSSLENLTHTPLSDNQRLYINRAQQASGRLSGILQGMSEAARLEQSFDHAERERFDLAAVVAEAAAAYQALTPEHRIGFRGRSEGCPVTGSAELMVQLLDKLVDNARDFTPPQGRIEIGVTRDQQGRSTLTVSNDGPPLPAHLSGEIFNPFVSLRPHQPEGHLGQGLVIVRLITEFHGGTVSAANRDGGVVFTVTLPADPG